MSDRKLKKILLIEDEKALLDVMSIKLKGSNFEVFSASGGEAGIRLAREKKPDLILLDILMPKMNGYEALERLKGDAETRDIPVIILSNSGRDEEEIEKCRRLGAADYLVKAQLSLDEVVKKSETMLKG